jgi:hypothetical protein
MMHAVVQQGGKENNALNPYHLLGLTKKRGEYYVDQTRSY